MTSDQRDAIVHQAIQLILLDKKSYTTSLNWAINYCRTALTTSGDDLRTQCLYILSNITHWRHPDARYVRETLRKYVAGQTDRR